MLRYLRSMGRDTAGEWVRLTMALFVSAVHGFISLVALAAVLGYSTSLCVLVFSSCVLIRGQWAELSFCTGNGQPRPPQSPAALQVSSGEPKARVLTCYLSMGAWISSMKPPSGMHDPRGSESTHVQDQAVSRLWSTAWGGMGSTRLYCPRYTGWKGQPQITPYRIGRRPGQQGPRLSSHIRVKV